MSKIIVVACTTLCCLLLTTFNLQAAEVEDVLSEKVCWSFHSGYKATPCDGGNWYGGNDSFFSFKTYLTKESVIQQFLISNGDSLNNYINGLTITNEHGETLFSGNPGTGSVYLDSKVPVASSILTFKLYSTVNRSNFEIKEVLGVDRAQIPSCDGEHLELCQSEEKCTSYFGSWCNDQCLAVPCVTCDIDNLDLCNSSSECEGFGYWYSETCNPSPVCSPEYLTGFCQTKDDCIAASGEWINGICQSTDPLKKCQIPVLTELDKRLHIPIMIYDKQGDEKFIWLDLQLGIPNGMSFQVLDFGAL